MSVLHRNFVAGEWVEGASVNPNINPSDTNDVVGEYAQADAAQTQAAIQAAKAAFPAWSRTTPQERHDVLLRASIEILARRDELGRLLAREEGKTLPEAHRRSRARRPDLRFLRRRSAANTRREVRLHSAERRHRGDARADGRRGDHRAVELPDRHSGLEDRPGAGVREHGGVQARRARARLQPMRSPKSSSAPAFRKARSTSSWGGARSSARRCSRPRTSTRSPSPDRSRPAGGWPPPAPRRCANSNSKWAARTRSSSSPTPTCRRQSNVRSTARSSRRVSAARPPRGSSSRSRSTTRFTDALVERMRGAEGR